MLILDEAQLQIPMIPNLLAAEMPDKARRMLREEHCVPLDSRRQPCRSQIGHAILKLGEELLIKCGRRFIGKE